MHRPDTAQTSNMLPGLVATCNAAVQLVMWTRPLHCT